MSTITILLNSFWVPTLGTFFCSYYSNSTVICFLSYMEHGVDLYDTHDIDIVSSNNG